MRLLTYFFLGFILVLYYFLDHNSVLWGFIIGVPLIFILITFLSGHKNKQCLNTFQEKGTKYIEVEKE